MPYGRRRTLAKRRYAPLYRSVRTPQSGTGIGPNDGIFTRLTTHGTIRWTASGVATGRSYITIPINFLYFNAGVFDQLGGVFGGAIPTAGEFSYVSFPLYTGWADALKPFVTYRIAGVAIRLKFYVPFSQTDPQLYKFGILAERDFGTGSINFSGGPVTSIIGAAPWYSAQGGILADTEAWSKLNQKAYRVTTSQPGIQTYTTLSAYIDAAKMLHWDKSYYKSQSQITGGITSDSSTGEFVSVTQPATRIGAQIAFEARGSTDGTPNPDMPNFMFDYSLTYFIRAVDPHTLQNIVTMEK